MAKQTINNGESGLSVRTKLNENFTELYNKQYIAILNFHSDGTTNFTLTNQAAGEQGIGNTARNEIYFDASSFTQVRVSASVMVLSASVANPRLYPQYHNGSTWVTVGTGLTTQCISLSSTGTKKTDWLTIPTAALGDVIWRIAAIGGDGVADPALGNISLQFK